MDKLSDGPLHPTRTHLSICPTAFAPHRLSRSPHFFRLRHKHIRTVTSSLRFSFVSDRRVSIFKFLLFYVAFKELCTGTRWGWGWGLVYEEEDLKLPLVEQFNLGGFVFVVVMLKRFICTVIPMKPPYLLAFRSRMSASSSPIFLPAC
ncbi:hypothetical protein CRENBAI_025531 [Crenichthys baileyi]|uniref:Uncharacterized protein n=1 Tax=Crenichthys baileyi TaxID=28760 RepID=A0AAV9RPC7_9TELE